MPADNLSVYHFFPMAMSVAALALGSSAMINCRAVEIPPDTGDSVIDAGVLGYRTKGFFTTDDAIWVVDVCRPYSDIRDSFGFDFEEDNWMQTLERIAYTIPVLGGIASILLCVATCAGTPHPLFWKLYGVIFVVCCILQGFGLKIMDSFICTNNPVVQYLEEDFPNIAENFQSDCQTGMGYKMGISAVVFWALAGISCLALADPSSSEEAKSDNVPEAAQEDAE